MLATGAALGGFLFGFDTSTMNAAINGIKPTLGLGAGAVGFVMAVSLLGCALGAWFAGPTSTRIGRTRVMVLAGALVAAGSLGAALSSRVAVLGVFRSIVGVGIGAASAVVPAYVAEISPTAIRGRLGSLWQFAIVIGQLLGLLAGYGITLWAGDASRPMPWGGVAWRWEILVVVVLGLGYVLIARALPPSPHELLRTGREQEAKALLSRTSDAPVEARVAAIRDVLEGRRDAPLGALRGPRLGLKGIVWIGILLAAFQQLVGINVVKTYSTMLWRSVGFSTGSAFTISLVTVVISIASTVVAIAIMDRVGRRPLLVVGAAVMVVSLVTLAVCFATAGGGGDDVTLGGGAAVAALIAMNVFAVAFGTTWGPVMWLMLGELFDGDLRTSAVAVCTAVNWMTNWLVTRSLPAIATLGVAVAYGLFAVFAALGCAFALRVLPETRSAEVD
jgi:SP family sugar:H+ symporter-like MFS transporter